MIEAGEYQGVQVFLSPNGDFVANIDGMKTIAPSMVSMKKKISTAKQVSFEPFDVISNYYNNEVRITKIINVRKSTGRVGRGQLVFVGADGQEFRTVLPATPENIELCKAEMRIRDECQNEIRRQRLLMDVAREAIVAIGPDRYLESIKPKTEVQP